MCCLQWYFCFAAFLARFSSRSPLLSGCWTCSVLEIVAWACACHVSIAFIGSWLFLSWPQLGISSCFLDWNMPKFGHWFPTGVLLWKPLYRRVLWDPGKLWCEFQQLTCNWHHAVISVPKRSMVCGCGFHSAIQASSCRVTWGPGYPASSSSAVEWGESIHSFRDTQGT